MKFLPGLLLAIGATGVLSADVLSLSGDARLSGTVRSINEAGVAELASELSPEPVLLKAGAFTRVDFGVPGAPAVSASQSGGPDALIELTNGDRLPVTVAGLDAKNLTVVSAAAGQLVIPRAALKLMKAGVRKPKVIYSGPRADGEWSRDKNGQPGWMFSENALTSNGQASASKYFETPERFSLKFTLKWQGNPWFKIYFADPLTPNVQAVDRYFLQFNGNGLEVKRESSEGQHYKTVIDLPRTPDQFPDNQLEVEIQVDRKISRLQLFLNGEPETPGIDAAGKAPVGKGVTITSSAPAGVTHELRGIEISELDNSLARHKAEERGDVKTDSLITRDEDRWSGRLLDIRRDSKGAVYSFKSDFQEAPLELEEAVVSTVFFANPAPPKDAGEDLPLVLRLREGGSLRVSACSFSPTEVIAAHPLLGSLKINRAGISALERTTAKPEIESEGKSEAKPENEPAKLPQE